MCLTLCDPTDCSLPGFSVRFFQTRVLEWVAIPFSKVESYVSGEILKVLLDLVFVELLNSFELLEAFYWWACAYYEFFFSSLFFFFFFLAFWLFSIAVRRLCLVALHGILIVVTCRAQPLGRKGSVVVHGLSCSLAHGIFLNQRLNPCLLHCFRDLNNGKT